MLLQLETLSKNVNYLDGCVTKMEQWLDKAESNVRSKSGLLSVWKKVKSAFVKYCAIQDSRSDVMESQISAKNISMCIERQRVML